MVRYSTVAVRLQHGCGTVSVRLRYGGGTVAVNGGMVQYGCGTVAVRWRYSTVAVRYSTVAVGTIQLQSLFLSYLDFVILFYSAFSGKLYIPYFK